MRTKYVIAAVVALAAVAAAAAGMEVKPEFLIKSRQAGYTYMAWNMGRIKAQLDAPATYKKEEVIAAANVIAAIANSGMGSLFAPGTEKGSGFHETKAKPGLFTDFEEVKKVASTFNKEANELAKVAAAGELAQVKEQYEKVGKSCKGCHEKFKLKE